MSDILGGSPVSSTVTDDLLRKCQRRDQNLRILMSYLENGILPKDFKVAQNVMTKAHLFIVEDNVLKNHRTKRAVVPNELKDMIIDVEHRGPLAGHFSSHRLFKAISGSWYWEGMYKDISKFCRVCPQCLVVSGSGKRCKPPLFPIPVQRPFQIVGVDIMDLPLTDLGNKHVAVFQDYFTKWPLVFAVPDQKSKRLVELLVNEVVPFFGVPEALLSDRGTNLLSHLMTDVCDMLGIHELNTTPSTV
jgi:hypothetical protein